MPEIRHRLTLPDNDIIGLGRMQPCFEPDPGRSYKATDLSCKECGASVGAPCTGKTFCAARMDALKQAIADGTVESRGPARPEYEPCPDCVRHRRNGRPLGCSPAHTCVREIAGVVCKYAREPNSDFCEHHRVTRTAGPKAKPGRPKSSSSQAKKLTDEQRQEIKRRFADGTKIADLARDYDVAASSIRYVLGLRES